MDDRPSGVTSVGTVTVPHGGASSFGLPTDVVAALFATKDPQDLDRIMDRTFSGRTDDTLLTSLVNLAHSFAHALERFRRRRGLRPLKLRCTQCVGRD